MTPILLGFALFVVLVALPMTIQHYLRGLPEAPACPRCRAVTRQAMGSSEDLAWLSSLSRTFLAECSCGWRGRMRWRWARQSAGPQPPS